MAVPVLALQWAYAGHEIIARARTFALAVAVPTLYLWVADSVAACAESPLAGFVPPAT